MNRLNGALPKIGIRPTIDGRCNGIRESLEQTILGLAKAVADFLSANLRHPSGEPVECVIPEKCIGGVAESAQVAELFKNNNVGVSITVTSCWCYGSETMDMDKSIPKAVWGFNGTERPGAVYLAAVLAAHAQKGIPAYGIYGKDVCDAGDTTIPDDVAKKLLQFAKAGIAVATMKGKSYLAIGSVSMGIAGSIVDPNFFEKFLGMRCEYVDMTEIIRRIDNEIFDKAEFAKAKEWVAKHCKEGADNNKADKQRTPQQKAEDWDFVIKTTLIVRDLMIGNPTLPPEEALGHNAIASGFQGQRQFTDHYPNADFTEALLNSSFDWNGLRQAFIVATENDALNGVSMLLGHLLTNTPSVFADVRTYWSPDAIKRVTGVTLEGMAKDGFIHLVNSGSAAIDGCGEIKDADGNPCMKPFWELTEKDADNCMAATKFCPANLDYFRGGGYSSDFMTKGTMPVTMMRVNLIDGLGPVLQIAEGYAIDLPEKVAQIVDDRTDPTWPTTWFVPRLTGTGAFADVYSVMNNWGANHGSFNYGHIGAELITLASMLRIPVCMHNVDESDIFRPSVWNAYGMDKEGSDYRACATYGPMYK